jgi:putative hemolysin
MNTLQNIDRFTVQLADSGPLLRKAQSLRHQVFLGIPGIDEDTFDPSCIHVIVIDKETDRAVGTYRLLLGSVAQKRNGFSAEVKFDLSNIKKNCSGECMEMGRACVDGAYRKYPIINLMWGKINSLIKENNVRYLFGCPRVEDPSPKKIGAILAFFKKYYFAPSELEVYPLKKTAYDYDPDANSLSKKEAFGLLPSLIKGYLKMGALVCGAPAWNHIFKTVIFFMILETSKMDNAFKSKMLYAKDI